MNEDVRPTLVADSVKYRSDNDERAFFEWLQRIEGVTRFEGVGRELRIDVSPEIDEWGLRDLIALFFRYGIDVTQIPKVFPVDEHPWLHQDTAYWFRAMFSQARSVTGRSKRSGRDPGYSWQATCAMGALSAKRDADALGAGNKAALHERAGLAPVVLCPRNRANSCLGSGCRDVQHIAVRPSLEFARSATQMPWA